MKSLKWQLLVIVCILVCFSTFSWSVACAPFGQTGTGTISSPGQTNSCTFSANAGDVLDFTMVTTSGSLSPKIQLYNPIGTLVASATPGYCQGSTVEMNTVTLLL